MKKNKQKAIVKEQKKAAKKELTNQIKAALGSVIVNFADSSKSIDKIIAKSTKQLVKKLSKEKVSLPIPIETPVVAEQIEVKTSEAPKPKKTVKVKS